MSNNKSSKEKKVRKEDSPPPPPPPEPKLPKNTQRETIRPVRRVQLMRESSDLGTKNLHPKPEKQNLEIKSRNQTTHKNTVYGTKILPQKRELENKSDEGHKKKRRKVDNKNK